MKIFEYIFLLNEQKYKIHSTNLIRISEIINFLNYPNKLAIIVYNGKICSNLTENLYLKNKDYLEIITIVGGG